MASDAENLTDAETFAEAQEILISHGHFDHLMNVPELSAARELRVHCTDAPRKTLLRCGVPERQIHCCAPGDAFDVEDVSLRVFQGRHNVPDAKMTLGVAFRALSSVRRAGNFLKMANVHKNFPEAGETVVFEIKYGGRRILSMGSIGLPENAEFPAPGAELLILPYQGTSNPAPAAMRIVEALRPKAIVLSHIDDAIPPLTGRVHIKPLLKLMGKRHPEIPVCVPKFGEVMSLSNFAAAAEYGEAISS